MLYPQAVQPSDRSVYAAGAPELEVQENVCLAPYTTLGIGGPARFFADIATESELLQALAFAREHRLAIFVLGGGSNLLIPDRGFAGLVLHVVIRGPVLQQPASQDVDYIVPAGLPWDDLVLTVCQAGLSGMECLAGIPGLTGGTPVQNVGAYGQEVASTIHTVRVFDLHAEPFANPFLDLSKVACHFAYRSSIFNSTERGRYIITSVTFRLSPETQPNLTYPDLAAFFAARSQAPTPLNIYHAVREIRRRKGMLLVTGDPDCASAGSFFKNPIVPAELLTRIATDLHLDPASIPHWPAPSHNAETHLKLPAAWLLERAGFSKSYTLGAAGISSRHTLALINRGGATGSDIVALRDLIRAEVLRRFGIFLEQEPVEPGAGTHLSGGL